MIENDNMGVSPNSGRWVIALIGVVSLGCGSGSASGQPDADSTTASQDSSVAPATDTAPEETTTVPPDTSPDTVPREDTGIPAPPADVTFDTVDAYGYAATDRPAGTVAELSFRDRDSGVVYDALGRTTSGAMAARLKPLPGYNQFWFAWSVFNHDSEIFGTSERVSTGSIDEDDECAVPCDQIVLGCPGRDCIPALTRPEQVSVASAEAQYLADNSYVVGVEIDGDVRAYPHNVFWWHEIVNDEVGGVPIAVTHCPLTFSSLGFDPTGFVPGETVELGVSGRLFNNNLTFYVRADDSWYVQLLGVGTRGIELGQPAPQVHLWEMTWAAWRALHPETTVLTDATGYARNYRQYPYDSYFVDQLDFRPTNPPDDGRFRKKEPTYGVRLDGAAKAYPYAALAAWVEQTHGPDAPPAGVINDSVGRHAVVIVFDLDARYVQAFDRSGLGMMEQLDR